MDNALFLQHLRDAGLEEGRTYIQEHIQELVDYAAIGDLLADEALKHLFTPFLSLKLAELLTFFGESAPDEYAHALVLKAKGDAIVLYERMLAIYPTVTDQGEASVKRAIAMAQESQVVILSWLGDFEQARRLLQEVHAAYSALAETGLMLTSQIALAELDYAQGYYGSALKQYYQAQDMLVD